LLIFAGCVKNLSHKISDKELLRQRVETYWGHLVNRALDKTYFFEYPLLREKMSMESGFTSRMLRKTLAVQIKWKGKL